jgi:hypothetical protein
MNANEEEMIVSSSVSALLTLRKQPQTNDWARFKFFSARFTAFYRAGGWMALGGSCFLCLWCGQ